MFKAKVNKSFTKSFNTSDVKKTDLTLITNNKLLLRHQSKNFEIDLIESNFNTKTYHLKINGNSYAVELEDELAINIAKMGFSMNNSKKINSITSPMPGLILNINVKEGQEVKSGDVLLVLEAMKMENSIISPKDGIVKLVSVKKGLTVEKNEHLIELS
ncbi:MAG: acetyl-CoA carboxylase biotin carboxyl carrier protein subunit [Lutibacter sp.]|uniref:acetyl-CoA carboxylase biotin carboxyl carrier protein subunit n=1 Tax=Lutibacter sp. TaxID=1925666 RepID=UPI00299EEBA6|nr:acetyl-CoA carboxylase biotin carboxyl carrier protein subunit [Lutibacter sp.]MDX1830279.1 acetyl-CoA carboxylase biotin carboxyl carrier protein subunit [Lutibacter sp.]